MIDDKIKYKALREDNDIFVAFIEAIFYDRDEKGTILKRIKKDQLVMLRESGMKNQDIADTLGISLAMLSWLIKYHKLPKRKNKRVR